MTAISIRAVCSAVVLSASLSLLAPEAAAQKDSTIALRFNWPVGLQGKVTMRRVAYKIEGPKADTTDRSWTIRFSVAPDAAGRRVVMRDFYMSDRGDKEAARPALAPLSPAALDSLPSITVKPDGEIAAYGQFDLLVGALQRGARASLDTLAGVTPGGAAFLERMLGLEHVKESIAREWQRAIGFWAEADLEPGSEYKMEDEGKGTALMPEARVPTTTWFALKSRTTCSDAARDSACVHLVVVERARADSLNSAMDALMRQMVPASVGRVLAERFTLERRIDVITEPSTLLPVQFLVRELISGSVRDQRDSVILLRQENVALYTFAFEMERSPLRLAAEAGDERGVVRLLQQGAAAGEVNVAGEPVVYAAAAAGHGGVVKRLVASGADADQAYVFARSRGHLAAMRLLRPHAKAVRPLGISADSAVRLYEAGALASSAAAFADLAIDERTPGVAHAWLARVLLSGDDIETALSLARLAARGRSCSAVAHDVLAVALAPWSSEHPQANADSARWHTQRAAACAPGSGAYAIRLAWVASLHGDTAAESAALRNALSAGIFPPGAIARARWILEALPPRAVLLTRGMPLTFALHAAQLQSVRPDVTIIDVAALDEPDAVKVRRREWNIPASVTDAVLDSIAATGNPRWRGVAAEIVRRWRDAIAAGASARPLALSTTVDASWVDGAGGLQSNGSFYLVTADSMPKPVDPRVIWRTVKAAPAQMRGPATDSSDHEPSHRQSNVWMSAIYAAATYLTSMRIEVFMFDQQQLAAADSLTAWVEQEVAPLDFYYKDDLLRELANTRTQLGNASLDFPSKLRHARRATELNPRHAIAWNNLGYYALVKGRLAVADSALRRAHALAPRSTIYLNLATVARLTGQLDSATTWLQRGEAFATAEQLESKDENGVWTVSFLPRNPGDTLEDAGTAPIATIAEKQSLFLYNRGIVEAARGNLGAADAALAKAEALAASPQLLCYAANLMEATRGWLKLSPASTKWLTTAEARFRKSGCSPPR